MIAFADKQAARGAGWMTLATLLMLGAGIVALSVGIPLLVSGLFLITAAPCALVTVSLFLVAVRGRGGEAVAAVSVDPPAEEPAAAESAVGEPAEEAAEPEAEAVATADTTDG
jgi:hypothetical protein